MDDNLEKKTLNFRRGDWDFIESICRPRGIPTSTAIRTIVSQFVDARREPETETVNLETDL
jgi:hypothetical protein